MSNEGSDPKGAKSSEELFPQTKKSVGAPFSVRRVAQLRYQAPIPTADRCVARMPQEKGPLREKEKAEIRSARKII
jgi:hypothetical protein